MWGPGFGADQRSSPSLVEALEQIDEPGHVARAPGLEQLAAAVGRQLRVRREQRALAVERAVREVVDVHEVLELARLLDQRLRHRAARRSWSWSRRGW